VSLDNSACILHIGIDDFDSYQYGCTTHAATHLLHRLVDRFRIAFIDYPNLVRLNPSIPWKTRGNGAVALRISVECSKVQDIVDYCRRVLLEYCDSISSTLDLSLSTHDVEPGLVIVANTIPSIMAEIYTKALSDVVLPSIVIEKLMRYRNVYLIDVFKNRGVVGASAAIGWFLAGGDYTYELLTYRSKKLYGMRRCIEIDSVKEFDEISRSSTFNNIDDESGRILIESHGADPVLYGVRGESPEAVRMSLNIIKTCEPIVAWTVFRSNQATDAHGISRNIDELRMYTTAKLHAVIISRPEVLPGGAVMVKAFDATGSIDLVFFKPSTLTSIAMDLNIGDEIIVQGHVKPWGKTMVFHVEKIQVVDIKSRYMCRAPRCQVCKKRVEKMGLGKGYRCKRCDVNIVNPELDCEQLPRVVEQKLYIPPARMQKHLIKPLSRYGKEKIWKPLVTNIELAHISQIIEPLWFL